MTQAPPEGVSVYDRLVWPEGALEHDLATGAHRRELTAYLGAEEYAALVPLARTAASVVADPARRVLLVPGIMGSQLAIPRPAPLPDDLLWIDPSDFQQGGLLRLALEHEGVQSCGPVVYSYLRLKFALATRGYTVRCFDYDWRHGVAELGGRLAAVLQREAAPCSLVCHSMGGLVARAALALAPAAIDRIVTLGTPHAGAYAPLQALRGVYGTVRRLAQLDPERSAEDLATRVFAGFPSLYDMLPRAMPGESPDWFELSSWPGSAPAPRPAELARSARLQLPSSPERLFCIAGTGQPTVTAAHVAEGELCYSFSAHGDGTVPVARAQLPGHVCRYVALPHSELPRDATVAEAVVELLADGRTTLLSATEPEPDLSMPSLQMTDSQLRERCTEKLDWQQLDATERRAWFDSLNAPLVPLS